MRTFNTVLSIIFCVSLVACGDTTKDNGASQNLNGTPEEQVLSDEGEVRNENRNMTRDSVEGQSLEINLGEIALPTDATVSLGTLAAHGEVSINEHQHAIYHPNHGYYGYDEFKYTVLQSNGQKDIYTIAINIAALAAVSTKITGVQVTNWKNDATAAYSIIHDDLCAWGVSVGGMFRHWRELSNRNLVAGFGVIAGSCGDNEFAEMHTMVDAGMEMVNHSYSHIDLQENVAEWDREFDLSTEILRQQGFEVSYYAYPFDSFNENMFKRLNNNLGYLGSRGGRRDSTFGVVNAPSINASDDLQSFRHRFDIYNEFSEPSEPRFSAYTGGSGSPLDKYVDDAIRHGGWALRELHGIEFAASWGNVPLDVYLAHLDYVKNLVDQNSLWVDTPTNVTRYQSARTHCGDPILNDNSITFMTPTAAGCQKFATPLTVIITTPDQASIKARQNGQELQLKALDDTHYMLNIDPTKGATEFISK